MDLELPYTGIFLDDGSRREVSYIIIDLFISWKFIPFIFLEICRSRYPFNLGFAYGMEFLLGEVEKVKFFLVEQGGRVFVAPLGKKAVEKLCRCVLILAGISMHCDTELPVWQPRACNRVCLLRQVVMVRS